MKQLIYITLVTVLLNNVSVLAEGGRAGGGPSTISPNAKLAFEGSSGGGGLSSITKNLLNSFGSDTDYEDIIWQKVESDTLININKPELINVIKMNDGTDFSYPEANTLIKPVDVDRVILNDGNTIKFDTTLVNPFFK
jgi:hypothetical protein